MIFITLGCFLCYATLLAPKFIMAVTNLTNL